MAWNAVELRLAVEFGIMKEFLAESWKERDGIIPGGVLSWLLSLSDAYFMRLLRVVWSILDGVFAGKFLGVTLSGMKEGESWKVEGFLVDWKPEGC